MQFDIKKQNGAGALFVDKKSRTKSAKDDGQKWTLSIAGTDVGKTYDIFAVYQKSKSKLQTVGKLRVVSYEKQQHSVTLVPVGVDAPNVGEVQKRLNGIYAPYGVEFTVKVDDAIKELEGWKGRAFKLEGNGFFTRENADMAEIRKAYQNASSVDKDEYYIFVLGGTDAGSEDCDTQAHGAQGDMPRGQRFGYIFGDQVRDIGWLLAHELGHGVFTLKHLNEANYAGKSSLGTLPNLMDYTGSTQLAAFQWNVIANPAILTGLDSDDASKVVTYKIEGKWTDLDNKDIDGVKLGRTVRFHITTDLPNGMNLKLQLFDEDVLSDDDDFNGHQVYKDVVIVNSKASFDLELPESWNGDIANEGPATYRTLYWRVATPDYQKKIKSTLNIFFSERTLYVESSRRNTNTPQIYTTAGEEIVLVDLAKIAKEELVSRGLDKLDKTVWAIIRNSSTSINAGVTLIGIAQKVGSLYDLANLVDFARTGGRPDDFEPLTIHIPNGGIGLLINTLGAMVASEARKTQAVLDEVVIREMQQAKEKGVAEVERCIRSNNSNSKGVVYQIHYVSPVTASDILQGKVPDIETVITDSKTMHSETVQILIRKESDSYRKINIYVVETFFIK